MRLINNKGHEILAIQWVGTGESQSNIEEFLGSNARETAKGSLNVADMLVKLEDWVVVDVNTNEVLTRSSEELSDYQQVKTKAQTDHIATQFNAAVRDILTTLEEQPIETIPELLERIKLVYIHDQTTKIQRLQDEADTIARVLSTL